MTTEIRRKTIHTTLALILAGIAPYLADEVLMGLGIGLFVFFALSRISGLYARIGVVPRVTFGELFFALGVLGASILAGASVALFQVSMVVLAFADTLAALVGRGYGRYVFYVLDEKRTITGSVTCFIVSTCIFLLYGSTIPVALGIGGAVAVIEAVSVRGSDNLFIPLTVVVLLQVL